MKTFLILTLILFFLILALAIFVGRLLTYNDIKKRKIPNKSKLDGFDVKDISFTTSEKITLRGWFIKGINNNDGKTLILLHGWHRNRERIIQNARLFAKNGFNIVMYDQRSHGESDTALITFGKGEAKDLLSCVDYLKTKEDVNIEKLGAVGFSLGSGGLVYATALSKEPLFKAIILEGAYANSYDTGLFMLQNKVGKFWAYVIGIIFFTLGSKIVSFGKFKHSLPYKFIGQIKSTPILIIRGKNDYMVPKESIDRLINAIETKYYVWYTEEGNHTNAIVVYPDEYEKRTLDFLNKYIK